MKTSLHIKDIVIMNIVGIVSLRQIPNVAPYGASSILLWIIAAFCFFVPLALVCGELSGRYPQDGGMFIWIKDAFGVRTAWICTVFYLASCVVFFPMLLFFGFSALAHTFDISNKAPFIGIGGMLTFILLTYLNILGIRFTKLINSVLMYLGIFVPTCILAISAVAWVVSGGSMSSDYAFSIDNYLPNLGNFKTIAFASSMMFAFAGLELSSMVASRTQNPKKDFPRAILYSAIIIVLIYVVLTFCMNVIYPASKTSILDGFSQSVGFVCEFFGIRYVLLVLEICIFLGVLGQVNSWLVGPMYMLKTASLEPSIKGDMLSRLHPKYKTPYIALIVQAVFVSILCLLIAIGGKLEQAYWSLISLTTLCYFIPYLVVFPAFVRIKRRKCDGDGFVIGGVILPMMISAIGALSVLFAIVLTMIPPSHLDMSDMLSVLSYIGSMLGGVLLTLIFAFLTLKRRAR